jgi:hypothetical protein
MAEESKEKKNLKDDNGPDKPPIFNLDRTPIAGLGMGDSKIMPDEELKLLNKRIYDKSRAKKISHKAKHYKNIMTAAIIAIILIVVLAVFLIFISLSMFPDKAYVEEGTCFVRIKAIEGGEQTMQSVELPDTRCNTADDCRNYLLTLKFSEKDIDNMGIKCSDAG